MGTRPPQPRPANLIKPLPPPVPLRPSYEIGCYCRCKIALANELMIGKKIAIRKENDHDAS